MHDLRHFYASGLIAAGRAQAGEPAEPGDVWFAAQTEPEFRAGTIRTVQPVAVHAPAFVYLFTHRSPARGGWLGWCHCLDLPFVFGAKDVPGITAWTGSRPAVGHLTTWVQQRWLVFARTGEPADLGLDQPHHDPAGRPTMIIGKKRVSRTLPFDDE